MEKTRIRLRVNGEEREALAPVHHTLLEVLREELGLTGTKHGCELGECGTCTVLVDGRPVLSGPSRGMPGPRGHHRRGNGAQRRAASPPAGLRRAGRGAVRLLHARL